MRGLEGVVAVLGSAWWLVQSERQGGGKAAAKRRRQERCQSSARTDKTSFRNNAKRLSSHGPPGAAAPTCAARASQTHYNRLGGVRGARGSTRAIALKTPAPRSFAPPLTSRQFVSRFSTQRDPLVTSETPSQLTHSLSSRRCQPGLCPSSFSFVAEQRAPPPGALKECILL